MYMCKPLIDIARFTWKYHSYGMKSFKIAAMPWKEKKKSTKRQIDVDQLFYWNG